MYKGGGGGRRGRGKEGKGEGGEGGRRGRKGRRGGVFEAGGGDKIVTQTSCTYIMAVGTET